MVESESDKSEDENSDEEEEEEKLPVSRRAKSSQSDKENVCYNEDEDTEIEEGSGSAWRSKARSPGKNGLRGSKRRATGGSIFDAFFSVVFVEDFKFILFVNNFVY